jgi:LuxR family maltose regulon positive regulatory protein
LKVVVLQALAHHAQGEKERAVRLLVDALALAEPGGFIRTFVDEGAPMARLLVDVLSLGISLEYVWRLLAAFKDSEAVHSDPVRMQAPESDWVEPLSNRELDVLQLIAEGLTNQDIASRLYLSLNTVKAHTRNIYSKLGVNSRTQAVARARTLGILIST